MSEGTVPENETPIVIDEHPIALSSDEPFVAVEIKKFERKANGLSKLLPSEFGVWDRHGRQYRGERTSKGVALDNAKSWNEEYKQKQAAKQNAADHPPVKPGRRRGQGGPG